MMNVKQFIRFVMLFTGLFGVSTHANAAINAGRDKGWLTVASQTFPEDAIKLARKYSRSFQNVVVFRSTTGTYAVSLGWAHREGGKRFKARLINEGVIPSDSYFHSGKRFIEVIWSTSNVIGRTTAQILRVSRLALAGGSSAPDPIGNESIGIVSGLEGSGDDYLSLRDGPTASAREIARLRVNTRLTIHSKNGGWYQVDVGNGVSGWVFGRYVSPIEVPTIGPEPTPKKVVIAPTPEKEQKPKVVVVAKPDDLNGGKKDQIIKKDVAQKRVALVLGNSAYQNTLALPNPKNDAASMVKKLKSLNFEVVSGIDGTRADMISSIREFVKILPNSDVALFFYAGHAMQIKGKNYLIPVDAKLEESTAVDFETIDLASILSFINDSGRISIVLLDACRDNPLSRKFARSLGATRSAFVGQGLSAPTTARGNVLIGFSTAPGEVALDGDGNNSPFTTALLSHMSTADVEIEIMLKRVKSDVYENTKHQQEPWNNSGLRTEFYFNKTVEASND